MKYLLGGINAPLLTPIKNGNVDYSRYQELASYVVDSGITGLLVCGSTGECANLSCEEKRNLVSACCDSVKGKASIVFNVTELNPDNLRQNIEYAKKCGVDAVSCTPPFYFKYSPKAIVNFFKQVSSWAEGLPVYVYNIPSNTGNAVTPEILNQIAQECKNVRGVKDSSMDFMNLLEYRHLIKDKSFEFITGNDAQIVASLQHGACGAIVAFAGVFPKLCAKLYENYVKNNLEEANRLQDIILEFRSVARRIRPVASHKYLLALNGLDVGVPRFPILELDASEKEIIHIVFEKYKSELS